MTSSWRASRSAESPRATLSRGEWSVSTWYSRPERRDPPTRLLDLASDIGCLFAIDTDAHAPGQLDFLAYGAERAEAAGIDPDRIVTTWPKDRLLEWAGRPGEAG